MGARAGRFVTLVRRSAAVGAWFFVVVSLVQVLVAASVKWDDPGETFKLYHTVVDGRSYDAPGLTYTGVTGLVLAIVQAGLILAAALASTLPAGRFLAARRLGHAALLGWAGLWTADLLWVAGIDRELDSMAAAMLMSLLMGCTAARAVLGWSPRHGRPPRSIPPARAIPAPRPRGAGDRGADDDAFDRVLRAGLTKASRPAPPAAAVNLCMKEIPRPPPEAPPPAQPHAPQAPEFWPAVRSWLAALWRRLAAAAARIARALSTALRSGRPRTILAGARQRLAAALRRLSSLLVRQANRLSPG